MLRKARFKWVCVRKYGFNMNQLESPDFRVFATETAFCTCPPRTRGSKPKTVVAYLAGIWPPLTMHSPTHSFRIKRAQPPAALGVCPTGSVATGMIPCAAGNGAMALHSTTRTGRLVSLLVHTHISSCGFLRRTIAPKRCVHLDVGLERSLEQCELQRVCAAHMQSAAYSTQAVSVVKALAVP